MYQYVPIKDVYAREILDSRGNPTIEVDVLTSYDVCERASVPSGASTGKFEAHELRDGGERYRGLGVRKAVDYVNTRIAPELVGMNVLDQAGIDRFIRKLDGTEDKSNLGANAILGISLAVAKTAAKTLKIPLFQYLGGVNAKRMPIPMMNILNGGRHANNSLDVQEFMIMPVGAENFQEALQMGTEIYHKLKNILNKEGKSTAVGDEGGFAPQLRDAREAIRYLLTAIQEAGYIAGEEVVIALDIAASELYDAETRKYVFEGEQVERSTDEMVEYYQALVQEFPIVSIEDPFDEEDWEGFVKLTEKIGKEVQIVGDDLFVTNLKRLQQGIKKAAANAILVKVNQIGTLTEAMEAMELAKSAGYRCVVSHRSGETEECLISDLAVAFQTGQIKTGAPCRGERIVKYNQLLRIEEFLGESAMY